MLLARWGSKNGLVYICRKQTSSNSILVVTRSSPFWSKVVQLQSMLSHIFGRWTGWKISSTPFIIKKKKQIVKLKHEKTCYIYTEEVNIKKMQKPKAFLKSPFSLIPGAVHCLCIPKAIAKITLAYIQDSVSYTITLA